MKIVQFSKDFDRSSFSCEEDSLTNYLHTQVSQDIQKRLSHCFTAVNENNQIIGYYTLSSNSLSREEVPEKWQKKIPQSYNVPIILLGRLARDMSQKGLGLGSLLLIDALYKCYKVSTESLGVMAVVVDPISPKAIAFYEKFGFMKLDSGKMFLAMKQIKKMVEATKEQP